MAEETKIIRIIVDSSRAVDGSTAATRAYERMERQLGVATQAMGRMEVSMGRMAGFMKAQLSLILGSIAGAFMLMGRNALNAAAGMDELAEQLGVTTQFLQASQFSAVQNGVKLEQLETAYGKFSQKIGEAAGGSKEMIEALNGLGVKILDINGKLRPTEVVMTEVARAITGIEDPAKRAAVAVDFFGKAGTRMLPMLKDLAGGLDEMTEKARRAGAYIEAETVAKLDRLGDAAERAKLSARALFAEGGAGPLTAAIEGISRLMEKLAGYMRSIRSDWTALFTHDSNAGAKLGVQAMDLENKIRDADARLEKDPGRGADVRLRNQWRTQLVGVRAQLVSGPAGGSAASDPDGIGFQMDPVARSGGAGNPGVKGGGQGESDRISKLMRETGRDVAAANAYAEASERGSRAVADLEVHFKALKAAQDAYGTTADKNAGQVSALTAKIEEQMRAAERLKNIKDFNLGTEALERSNELLAAENGLINASVETRSRELTLIKLKHEVQAKGLDENNPKEKAAIERRGEAIAQNERLKAQGEEMRKANELWTEPLKNALQSIQQTAADAFEGMLNSGKFSFESLGQIFRKIVTRMAAEFLALAAIRPVMNVIVNAVGGSSSGLGGSTGGVSGGFGGGGGGGLLDAISGLFSTGQGAGGGNISGFAAGGGPMGPSGGAMAAQGGFFSSSTGLSMGSFGMGNLSGALGVGMGAMSLLNGGTKSTAGTIGGIGQMIGGGLMMIPTPWTMAAGAVISLASSILPGLFGGEEYQWDPLAGANVQFNPSASGYTSNATQQLGGKSIAGQFSGVGSTLDSFFKRAGGLTNPGNAFGAAVWNNQREGTTSTYEISPSQGSNQLTFDQSGDPSEAIDRMIAKVFYNSVQNNAAMNASPTLRTAFGNREPTSTADIAGLFDLIDAYDQLGKETTEAEKALKAIDESFAGLTAGAQAWGLSLAPITAELEKQRKAVAEDFLHTINSVLDPVGTALDDFAKEREAGMKEWAYINDNVKEVVIAQAKVEEYYAKRAADLDRQLNAEKFAAIGQLEDAIKRLSPGGALANLDPTGTLAGLGATYRATYAQATAGDNEAIARLAGEGTAYADYAKSYYADSPQYNAIRDQILADLRIIQAAVALPASSTTPLNTSSGSASAAQSQQLMGTIETLVDEIRQERAESARLRAVISRYVTLNEAA